MKISQTDNQLVTTHGGKGSVVGGIVFALMGIALIIWLAAIMDDPNVETTGDSALGYLLGGVFVLVGVLMALFASKRIVTLNKGGTSSVVSRRIIGSKKDGQSFSTADVVGVSLTTGMPDSGGAMNNMNTSSRRLSTLTLLLKDNTIIQVAVSNGGAGITINGISSDLIQKAPLSKEADQIAQFLGVPLQNTVLPNPIAMVQQVVSTMTGSKSAPGPLAATSATPSTIQPVPNPAPTVTPPAGAPSPTPESVTANQPTPATTPPTDSTAPQT
jgi:hypothetical protein